MAGSRNSVLVSKRTPTIVVGVVGVGMSMGVGVYSSEYANEFVQRSRKRGKESKLSALSSNTSRGLFSKRSMSHLVSVACV